MWAHDLAAHGRALGRRAAAEGYLRLRMLPGEQAQVDWGHFGRVKIGTALRTLWAFVIVLSWSRQILLLFCLNAAMPSVLREHVDASASIGAYRASYCTTTCPHRRRHDRPRRARAELGSRLGDRVPQTHRGSGREQGEGS